MMEKKAGLNHWADILVVVVYFILVLAVGFWSLCRPNRGSVKSYFLAGRSMLWLPVGASLFSSNIGSEHFVGLAGTGAASGIAIVLYEWFSMPLVLLLSWLFLPVYISAGVYTLPEYLQKRFGGDRLRIYLSVLAIVLYIITKLAFARHTVAMAASCVVITLQRNARGSKLFDTPSYISIVALLLVTGIYTVLGGLAAVIYTDTLQTVIMTLGAFALVGIGLKEVGGYNKLELSYMRAVPPLHDNSSKCGYPPDDAFNLLRDPVNSDQPWPGIILQSSLGCLWYWCCDQVIVQRTLAAKNLSHAKGGAILAGYLKIIPLFIMIWPGMISRALYPDVVACVDPVKCEEHCGNRVGCSNIAYPKLVLELMPNGLKGLLMAVMLSAIMSSLTSIFNSASTLFTMDLWRKMRTRASERELLIVGRVFIAVLCGLSILWIPLVKSSQGGQLFVYIQAVQGYFGTPIGALFMLAILWRRMNEHGAFWGIVIGHVCGVTRMVLDFVYPAPGCGEPDTRPAVVSKVHYTYFGQMSIVITSLAIVIISLITKAPDRKSDTHLTWWTRYRPRQENATMIEVIDDKQQKGPAGETTDKHTKDNGGQDEGVDEKQMNGMSEMQMSETKTSEDTAITNADRCRRWFDFVCGIPTESDTPVSLEEETVLKQEFLMETKFWRRFLNVNAVIGLIVLAFLIGYFR